MDALQFQPKLTPEFVIRSLHLKIPLPPRSFLPFNGVITDSRKIQPGCLFVALVGEKFDGHQFIEEALAKGARGIMCKKGTPFAAAPSATGHPSYKDSCIFPVEDTLNAYRKLAGTWRREFSMPLVAVAGSAGKTTTKEFLAALLSGKYQKILKTIGSQNGFVGIPMTLLELAPDHEAAVIEVGIDEIGTMQQHMTLVHPNASIVTSIGPEHLENLKDIPTVAREEGMALSYVSKVSGITAINLDDPWIRPHFSTLREGRKIPYSLSGHQVPMDMIQGKLNHLGTELEVNGLGLSHLVLPMPLPGKHNALNLLGAVAIAAGLGLTAEEMQKGLRQFQGAEGRSQIKELPGQIHVICDYYNAQPTSVEAGLQLLTDFATSGPMPRRRWACLADMLELGHGEEQLHRDLADKIIQLKIDKVLLYGPRMAVLEDELKNNEFHGQVLHFSTQQDLADHLSHETKSGDVILIKGSRSMKMEEVWKQFESYVKNSSSHT